MQDDQALIGQTFNTNKQQQKQKEVTTYWAHLKAKIQEKESLNKRKNM